MAARLRPSFAIGTVKVRTGSRREVALPITRLITGAELSLPVHVLHGREDGPTVWVDAAIHGDEVVGIEVIRRVLEVLSPKEIRGTLIAVPTVNVIGTMSGDRYLPDGRDLNRSFPGSARGSLAARIAHLMMSEIVDKCDVGIDLHSASGRRSNLPQIRCDLEDGRTRELAEAFGAPVTYHARLRDGSLRSAARERGARVLLYEAGEAWRFDEWAITAGVDGVLRVLTMLGMIERPARLSDPVGPTEICWRSGWVRARRTGILGMGVELGQHVRAGERLGELHNSFGRRLAIVKADRDGIVIGRTEAPLVNSGDALVHIGSLEPGAEGDLDDGLADPSEDAAGAGTVLLEDDAVS